MIRTELRQAAVDSGSLQTWHHIQNRNIRSNYLPIITSNTGAMTAELEVPILEFHHRPHS
jgi:hypothetical protein